MLRGKWENAFSGKQRDNVRKKIHVVSAMIWHLATDARHIEQKDNRPPAPNSNAKTDGEGQKPSKESCNRVESSSDKRSERFKIWENPSCKFWHPLVCQNYKSETGCINGKKCYFRHVEAEGKAQQEVKERWCERIGCLVEGVCTIGLCVSRFSSENICSTERRKIRIKSRRQILQEHVAPKKKCWKERVHLEELFKSVNFMSVVLARLSLRRGHDGKPCTKKDVPKSSMDLAKHIYKLKNAEKATFYYPIEIKVAPAHISKSPEDTEFVVDSRASMHMLSKKDVSSEELETLRRSRTTTG